MRTRMILVAGFCLAGLVLVPGVSLYARVGGELTRKASWSQPTAEEVKVQIEAWLKAISATDDVRQKSLEAWQQPVIASSEGELQILDQTARAIGAVEPRAQEVIDACRADAQLAPRRFEWLFDDATAEFVRLNLRLLYGRWLAQHAHYDEAAEHLADILPTQVVDPASLLFYQCVTHHRLLKKDECLSTLAKLMENEAQLPRRYRTVARLMEADIQPLEPDSLDEIARLMDDIRRRLNFGQAGQRVRKEEDDVIAKLDKMIEEMEQQQQQQQAMGAGQGSTQSSSPAQDSQPLGGRGPGDVDQKRLGSKSGWGNLPPKEREEALQQISKDLPAHFREAIEEYFRKLARDGGN